jgi:YD repeat-containing protein
MKYQSNHLLMILTATIVIASCQKTNDNPTPSQIDSIASALPKQIIDTYTYDSLNLGTSTVTHTYIVSIKYDSINHRIDLYEDDTTNSNPYDVLLATYKYNNDGFLTSFIQSSIDYSRFATTFTATINRNPDNTISSIVEVPITGSEVDSTIYTYQSLNGDNSISTVVRSYDNQLLDYTYKVTYNYNASNSLTKVLNEDQGTYTYSYNSNNSLKSFSLQGADITANADYSYSSGLPDQKADVFLQTLLGKDFYIFDIRTFDPYILSVDEDFEYMGNSITDPFHVSNATLSSYSPATPDPFSTSATWTYQLNTQNNVTKMNFNGGSEQHVYTLKY